jgi:L-arabinokinase
MNVNDLFTKPASAEEQWSRFESLIRGDCSDLFDSVSPIAGARSPGRLDVMGGVADYSGSMVLEMPIAEAACVAWQWRPDRKLRIRSIAGNSECMYPSVDLSLDDLLQPDGYLRPIEEVHRTLTADIKNRWAAYIVGCYYIMLAAYTKFSEGRADMRAGELGANVLLSSEVPPGAGVSSSAAIEVATMHALNEAAGIHPSDLTLAAWCQRVENSIVGAPCGIMDQVTCALGIEENLLVMRCQPHDLMGHQRTPPGWQFVGIDSRVKHSVGGSAYTKARVGAFMGLKIIQLESGGKPKENYLCRLSPGDFNKYRDQLPERITGEEYSELYGRLPDTVTKVDANETYHPRSCAEHPVLENDRVKQFFGLMQLASARYEELDEARSDSDPPPGLDIDSITRAGSLMYDSHDSYSTRLDLGSPETDLLVTLIRDRGAEHGLFGAKITGGGAGGTVAVLYSADSNKAIEALKSVCDDYQRLTGIAPRTFVGSSPGALMFGARQIMRG